MLVISNGAMEPLMRTLDTILHFACSLCSCPSTFTGDQCQTAVTTTASTDAATTAATTSLPKGTDGIQPSELFHIAHVQNNTTLKKSTDIYYRDLFQRLKGPAIMNYNEQSTCYIIVHVLPLDVNW